MAAEPSATRAASARRWAVIGITSTALVAAAALAISVFDRGPSSDPGSARTRTNQALKTSVRVVPEPAGASNCEPMTADLNRRLDRGEWLTFARGSLVVRLHRGGVVSDPATFTATGATRLEALDGPLDLTVGPPPEGSVQLCMTATPSDTDQSDAGDDYGQIETTWQGTGPRVLVLGDSITVASRDALAEDLSDFSLRVGAVRGEGLSGGPLSRALGKGSMTEVAAAAAADEPAVAVIALGTNDAWSEQLSVDAAEAALGEIVDSLDGACIVTVSITETSTAPRFSRTEAAAINRLLGEVADDVVPWGTRSTARAATYLGDDGIHPTPAGTKLFADLVGEAVSGCLD